MTGEAQPTPRHVELYVRCLRPDGYYRQQAAVLDTLAGLVADGVVAERTVRVVGRQVPASVAAAETAPGRTIARRLSRFRAWAARNDLELEPALERRAVEDRLTDTRYRACRVPAMMLAEYRGDDLLCVTPHCADGTTTTVPDRLARLAAGDPTEFDPLPEAVPDTVGDATQDADAAGDAPDVIDPPAEDADGDHPLQVRRR